MLLNFLRDETGLELSEYAVAAALVVGGAFLAFNALASAVVNRINELTDAIN